MTLQMLLRRSLAASVSAALVAGGPGMADPQRAKPHRAAPQRAPQRVRVADLPAGTQRPTTEVLLSVGEGELITLPAAAASVWTSNPGVADVYVANARQIHLYGKEFGEATVFATGANGAVIYSTNVRVSQNITSIDRMMKLAMPEADIHITTVGQIAVMNGTVASPADSEQAQRLVTGLLNPGINVSAADAALKIAVVNRLRTSTPLQVSLQVRFAEVSRNFVKNVGVNMLTRDQTSGMQFGVSSGTRIPGTIGAIDTSTLPVLDASSKFGFPAGTISLPYDSPAGRFRLSRHRLQVRHHQGHPEHHARPRRPSARARRALTALDLGERIGQVTTLNNTNLTAISGETATFLAGGEIPIPISQGLGAVSVEYKQYGISLAYTPTVLADGRISLRVRPEVSQLSSAGAVQMSGTTIPALTTRRAETSVELGSGESFMIAGLLSNSHDNNIDKAPGLGDVPILGALFRSNAFQRNETELVIVITPYLVKPVNANDIALPTDGYHAPGDIERILGGQSRRRQERRRAAQALDGAAHRRAPRNRRDQPAGRLRASPGARASGRAHSRARAAARAQEQEGSRQRRPRFRLLMLEETPMFKRIALPLLLAPALLLGGCGTYNGGVESVYQPVVSRNDYSIDLETSGYALAPGESQRLAGWMQAMRLGYGDHVAIDDGADGSTGRDQIAAEVGHYGLLLSDRAPVTQGRIAPGSVRVVVTRMSAAVPNCPDYSRVYQPDYTASTSSNFGCAINTNLAAMVANPGDLVRGQPGADTSDPTTSARRSTCCATPRLAAPAASSPKALGEASERTVQSRTHRPPRAVRRLRLRRGDGGGAAPDRGSSSAGRPSGSTRAGCATPCRRCRSRRARTCCSSIFPESGDPLNDINALAEVCEPGTVVIASGQVNDVRLYRDLVASGIQGLPAQSRSIPNSLREAFTHAQASLNAPKLSDPFDRASALRSRGDRRARRGRRVDCPPRRSPGWISEKSERTTALLDLDVHFGTGALALDLEPGRGLTDAIENPQPDRRGCSSSARWSRPPIASRCCPPKRRSTRPCSTTAPPSTSSRRRSARRSNARSSICRARCSCSIRI